MKQRLLSALLAVLVTLTVPLMTFAQDEEAQLDARLRGYDSSVVNPDASTALTWLLFVFLGVIALGVLFKDAKRTHLD